MLSIWRPNFNNLPGLANLLEPPYNFGDIRDQIPEGNFDKLLSPDKSRMFGMAIQADFPASANFYRVDLYEEAGIPTDPAELVTYFADWDNVFDAAERLKARDRYMFTDPYTLLDAYMWGIHAFDGELNYLWNDDRMVEIVDVTKRIYTGGYASTSDLWSEEGKQELANGSISNVFMGTWFEGTLKDEHPDQEGLWRITALPGGIYAGSGGTLWGAYENANNPEATAAWVRFMGIPDLERFAASLENGGTSVPSYEPAWEVEGFDVAHDPYFGDQPVRMAIREIIQRVPSFTKTPMDGIAGDIFYEHIIEAVEQGIDSRVALQNAQEDVERRLASDIADRKEMLGLD